MVFYRYICLLLFLMNVDHSCSKTHFYITPALNLSCSEDYQPCITLSQFIANSDSYLGNETDIFLIFLPGSHDLDREFEISTDQVNNFSMSKDEKGNGTVFIECRGRSGRLDISNTTYVSIKGLHFIGCGDNRISGAEQLMVVNTIFQGVGGKDTVLVLRGVVSANILKSSFLSNNINGTEYHSYCYNEFMSATDQETPFLDLEQPRLRVGNTSMAFGGALCSIFSNVRITNSNFAYNRAGIGGVLAALNSTIYVTQSTYSSNRATIGGVMFTIETIVTIVSSTFADNVAELSGGVIRTYNQRSSTVKLFTAKLFTLTCKSVSNYSVTRVNSIDNSTFSNNIAMDGGVILAHSISLIPDFLTIVLHMVESLT